MKIEKISKISHRKFADKEMKQFFENFFDRKDRTEIWKAYSGKGKTAYFAAKKVGEEAKWETKRMREEKDKDEFHRKKEKVSRG